MLALLGLVGLAVAGTAFVGVMPSDEGADAPPTDTDDTVDLEETQDLLAQMTAPGAPGPAPAEPLDEVIGGEVITGTDSADTLTGTEGDDYIGGGDGNDSATGGDGDDQMHGHSGDDVLSGGRGDDLMTGDLGDDRLDGGAGADSLSGGSGDDVLTGGDGADVLAGGYGDDTLIGGAGEDNLQGSDGNDRLDGVTGEDVAQRDYLNGSEGNDHLIGNDGDVMSGGADADTFEVHSGLVSIMDYTAEDVLVLNHQGTPPVLTTQTTAQGVTLLADGEPVAALYGLSSFDVTSVQFVAG